MNSFKITCIAGLVSVLAACGGSDNVSTASGTTPSSSSSIPVPSSVAAAQSGYKISVFAKAPGTLRPDDLLLHGGNIFAIAQDNNNNPDGTNVAGTTPQSQVIEYDMSGNVVRTFNVPGHPDGLMEYDSHTIWVSTNEDADTMIIVIDTTANTQTTLTPDTAPIHGGGLDDMKMLNGVVYTSASNPNVGAATATASNGVSTVPAVYSVTLNSDHQTFHLTPVLMGNATANNIPTNTQVTLNMTDPDSMAADPSGNLVVDSQQDSELVFVSNPGANQSVSVLPLTLYGNSWPVDDTRWAPSGNSFMLLADNKAQLIYRIDATAGFTAGTAYSAGQGTLLQTNTSTGVMTPVFTGLGTPHGLIFVNQ
ncbi:hypothetical protein [Paraburkholderia haematera]|uniref:Uncharacterized protein n=1 Tax=Paraburkholderia haematera TaxID=2793077 RepID=A0ABN7L5Q9_9BURK|nr:hypothetical protein [Paraburkholderia haematera]CAE6732185.1 hypothetical protein R69888_02115 [Paraburkholderia haematera]